MRRIATTMVIALVLAISPLCTPNAPANADNPSNCNAGYGQSAFNSPVCADGNTVTVGVTVTDPGSGSGAAGKDDAGSVAGGTSGGAGRYTEPVPWETSSETFANITTGMYCIHYWSNHTSSRTTGPCNITPENTNTTNSTPDPEPSIEDTIRQALLQVNLPSVTPILSPNPAGNEWGALAVNLPIWIDAKRPSPVADTITQNSITITLTATPVSYLVNMGEGNPFNCVEFRARGMWSQPKDKSPVCGYSYKRKGTYQPTITVTWKINYTTSTGDTGEFRHKGTPTPTAEPLQIIELISVIIYDPNEHR